MLFRKRKPRSAVTVTLLASAAFLALAVYGWDVPVSELQSFLVILLGLLAVIVVAAFLMVALIKLFKFLFRGNGS